jgi:hypothetical protein
MTTLAHDTQNDNRFELAIKRARELGRDSVKSALSKPNLAIELVRGIVDDVIDDDTKIEGLFDAYVAARTKEVAKHATALGANEDNENSIKSNRSKHRQLALMANLPILKKEEDGAVQLLEEVTERRTALISGGIKVKPTYDAYVDVARAQLKQDRERIGGDLIDAIIAKPDAKESELIDKLITQYKGVYRLAEKMAADQVDVTHIDTARHALGDAITALGYELPAMTKESKKEAEVVGFLMAKGFGKEQAREIALKK